MKIANVDFAYVIDHAARLFASETNADIHGAAQAHEISRAWFASYQPIIETWLTPPAVCDVRGLVYRRLLDHLRGYPEHAPADNRTLMWVIAAGNAWDDEPGHMRNGYKPVRTASETGMAVHEWAVANGIWENHEESEGLCYGVAG